MNDLSWIEISKDNLSHNIKMIRRNIGDETILAPCVKANAYGHGLVETAKILLTSGANWLCVNSIEEAEILRSNNLGCPVLVIGYIGKNDLWRVLYLNVRIFLYDIEHAQRLSNLAKTNKKTVKVHIKIDTGMHRQGVLLSQAKALIKEVNELDNIEIEGLATHFANSDEPENPTYFEKQLEKFEQAVQWSHKIIDRELIIHCDKSASTLLYHHDLSTLVRPGIAIYGHYPGQSVKDEAIKKNIHLKPVLSLKTKIAQIKNIPKNSLVGYGCTYKTTRASKIATVPIGYYDGYDRKLSNRGYMLVNGKRVPILGRVCMNVTIVDITDCPNVLPEDEVVLIGRQGDKEITADDVAIWSETINYEIVTRLRESLPRYYI
jgi:alanine racemase